MGEARALADAGVKPELVICPWSDRFDSPSVYDREPNFVPSADRPLVYHLFGHFSVPDSLVLTEDDHFEFLGPVVGPQNLKVTACR